MMESPKRGVALMIVLVLLAVMASLVASLSSGLQSQVTLAHTQQDYQQAIWYAAGAESLALSTLSLRRERLYFGKNGGLEPTLYPVEQGTIRMSLSDMQACFNVNALATSDTALGTQLKGQLVTLLSLQGLPLSQSEALAEQIRIQVRGEKLCSSASLSGCESSMTSGADFLMADISELRAFRGVDAVLYPKVGSLLCTLPTIKQAINMNTLSPEKSVLLAAIFSPFLNADQARDLLRKRPNKGWESVEHFWAALPTGVDVQAGQYIKPFLQVDSRYLRLNTLVHVNTLSLNMQSFIARSDEGLWTMIWHQTGELQ